MSERSSMVGLGPTRPGSGMGVWAEDRLRRLAGAQHGVAAFVRAARKPGVLYVRAHPEGGRGLVLAWRPENRLDTTALAIAAEYRAGPGNAVSRFVMRGGGVLYVEGVWVGVGCDRPTWIVDPAVVKVRADG